MQKSTSEPNNRLGNQSHDISKRRQSTGVIKRASSCTSIQSSSFSTKVSLFFYDCVSICNTNMNAYIDCLEIAWVLRSP